jgi:Ca2+-binding EF-hand superfamily protein
MKSTSLLLCATALLAIALPVTVHAGGNKADKKAGKKAAKEVMALYDKNGNGGIDGDEVAAVQKAYAAEPNGILKQFDTNADGKLDDTEIAAIKAGKGGKKKNKNA